MQRALLMSVFAVTSVADGVRPGRIDLRDILWRTGEYVRRFERDFSAVITDEAYDQEVRSDPAGSAPRAGSSADREVTPSDTLRQRRHVRSEMLFMRVPGQGLSWLTARNVLEVDGQAVPDSADRLERAIKGGGRSVIQDLRSVADEGARFNLGGFRRNINDPNLPLLFFDPDQQSRFNFRLAGEEDIAGIRAEKIAFTERARPTVIHQTTGRNLPTRGAAWVLDDGTVIRTEISGSTDERLDFTVMVEYRHDSKIEMWMPVRMTEHYRSRATHEQVDCIALYSNPRRFETYGRVIR